jgi:hypothetical protein
MSRASSTASSLAVRRCDPFFTAPYLSSAATITLVHTRASPISRICSATRPCAERDQKRCWCPADSASEPGGLRTRIGDRRKILIEGRERGQQRQQGLRLARLDDQPLPFSPHDCVLSRKLEIARNAYGQISAILEKLTCRSIAIACFSIGPGMAKVSLPYADRWPPEHRSSPRNSAYGAPAWKARPNSRIVSAIA